MAFWPKSRKLKDRPSVCNPDASPYAVFDQVGLSVGKEHILQDLTLQLAEDRIGDRADDHLQRRRARDDCGALHRRG